MRILIIEDEVRLASTLSDLLHRQGYTTDICHDGLSGLDNAAGGIYDLVILDGMLPGLDGFSLLQQLLREQPGLSIREVAFASGFSDYNYFIRIFSKETGMPPGAYRQLKDLP